MTAQGYINQDEAVFRTFFPWVLFKTVLLLIIGTDCLSRFADMGSHWWLAGVALSVWASLVLVTRYLIQCVILRGPDIVIQRGGFTIHSYDLPLWQITPEVTQSILGRLLDYGTIRLQVEGQMIEMRGIARLRAFQRQLAQRRHEVYDRINLAHLVARIQVDPGFAHWDVLTHEPSNARSV